jgi:uncharacterized membrane protein
MSEKQSPALTRKMLMLVTACATMVALALIALPLVVGEPGKKWPDIVLFLGRFHMLVLHIPIGVFVLILLQELAAMVMRRADARPSRFALALGMISAVVAALAGFLLYHGSGDDYAGNELAERHLWAGMAFAVAAIATWLARLWADAMGANPVWYRLMLCATFGIMTFAGHDGASMTHGRDYLTKYAPEVLHGIMGAGKKPSVDEVVNAPDPVVYTEVIAPILGRRCVSCHNAEKSKGYYRMDTYELLVKGGLESEGLKPGSAAESHIVKLIELPIDDDMHMPPDGKPQVTAAELLVLRWWIDQGADPAKKLSESNATADIGAALKEIAGEKQPVAPVSDE